MIRRFRPRDMDALMALWLESTISGHPFIPANYWRESLPIVRDLYIPQSKTWVYTRHEALLGFISVLERQFIGALFVATDCTGQGVGSALITYVKARYPALSLEVYQKNQRAVYFYHRHGFRIEEGAWQQETRHPTWIMCWQAVSASSPQASD